jgi:hypothetical protein
MQTDRDAQIVTWLARIGAASAEHVMARFGMGRSWAYARLSLLVRDGLLEHKRLLYGKPGLYVATAEGLRWTFNERLGAYRLGPGGFQHAWELAATAVALHSALPEHEQLSDREIRVGENDGPVLIASASLGELPGGRPALHRPDLALIAPDQQVRAIEVELCRRSRVQVPSLTLQRLPQIETGARASAEAPTCSAASSACASDRSF